MKTDDLTKKIEAVTSRRLLPLEMLAIVNSHLPVNTILTSVTVDTTSMLTAQARTNTIAEIDEITKSLSALPEVAKVDAPPGAMQNSTTPFRLTVTFRPAQLEPEPPPEDITVTEAPKPAPAVKAVP